MDKKVDLNGTHVITSSDKVSKICSPLKDLGIPTFRYGRIYHDGSRIILSNHTEVLRFFYEEGYYPQYLA